MHIDKAGDLAEQRIAAVNAPDNSLEDIYELDLQIARHIRGILSAGRMACRALTAPHANNDAGTVFVFGAVALYRKDSAQFINVVDVVSTLAQRRALASAAAWVPEIHFQHVADTLLTASSPGRQFIGLAGFANRRWSMTGSMAGLLQSGQADIRIRACRAVGETASRHLVEHLYPHFDNEDASERFWAQWSASLLGNPIALTRLREFAFDPAFTAMALQLYLRFCNTTEAYSLLRSLAGHPTLERYAMIGAGVLGDPVFIPGLLSRMDSPHLARVAGEAFCLISGMSGEWPERKPSDMAIEADEQDAWDEDLPWPDQARAQQWWEANQARFEKGRRYLCGRTIDKANCKHVLMVGLQRQRMAAAFELARLTDNRQLFYWKARADVQKKAILGI